MLAACIEPMSKQEKNDKNTVFFVLIIDCLLYFC